MPPGTGTPVVGGLSTHQALHIVRGLQGINLVGMVLVEVTPAYDVSEMAALAGASIALDLLCLFATSQPVQQSPQGIFTSSLLVVLPVRIFSHRPVFYAYHLLIGKTSHLRCLPATFVY
ncbi:arginase family protein [Dasania marina]|uniref:arginase family protein n=1 Tax=Dasania marina TaxID=471499 RepID=UPI000374C6B5|nr:arginase family protein [Dasania marina]